MALMTLVHNPHVPGACDAQTTLAVLLHEDFPSELPVFGLPSPSPSPSDSTRIDRVVTAPLTHLIHKG